MRNYKEKILQFDILLQILTLFFFISLKLAKGCAKELPPTTDVLAIHRGNIVFRRSNHYQLPLGSLVLFTPKSLNLCIKSFFKLESVDQKLGFDSSCSSKDEFKTKF